MTRIQLLSGLSALTFLATAPALAESGDSAWFTLPAAGVNFKCKGIHSRVNHPASVIAVYTFDRRSGSDAWPRCEALCNATPGCVAFNWTHLIDTSTSPPGLKGSCELLNNANRRIDRFDGGPGEYSIVCYRGFPLDKYNTAGVDWRGTANPYQDASRPGGPGGGTPNVRYKP